MWQQGLIMKTEIWAWKFGSTFGKIVGYDKAFFDAFFFVCTPLTNVYHFLIYALSFSV